MTASDDDDDRKRCLAESEKRLAETKKQLEEMKNLLAENQEKIDASERFIAAVWRHKAKHEANVRDVLGDLYMEMDDAEQDQFMDGVKAVMRRIYTRREKARLRGQVAKPKPLTDKDRAEMQALTDLIRAEEEEHRRGAVRREP